MGNAWRQWAERLGSRKALAASLKSLYGYAVRFLTRGMGSMQMLEVSFEEALLAVRVSGAALASLVAEDSSAE